MDDQEIFRYLHPLYYPKIKVDNKDGRKLKVEILMKIELIMPEFGEERKTWVVMFLMVHKD